MTYGVCHPIMGVEHSLSQVLENQIYPELTMIPYSKPLVAETMEFISSYQSQWWYIISLNLHLRGTDYPKRGFHGLPVSKAQCLGHMLDNWVLFPGNAGLFSFSHDQTRSGTHPVYYPLSTGVPSLRAKWPVHDIDHSPPSSTKVINTNTYTTLVENK